MNLSTLTGVDRTMSVQPTQTLSAQSLDSQLMQQIFAMGGQIGEVISSVKSQKEVLEVGNKTLENDIVRIKQEHLKDLNGVVDGWEAKAICTIEKLEIIVQKFKSYMLQPPSISLECGRISIDIVPLQDLMDSLPDLDYEELKKYPDDSSENNNSTLTNLTSSPFEQFLKQTNLFIQSFIEPRRLEMENLEEEIYALRITQEALQYQKKRAIDFHESFIQKINLKIKEQLDLSAIYMKALSIIQKIEWDKRTDPGASCLGCRVLSSAVYSPYIIKYHHELNTRANLRDLSLLKEEVLTVMSSIEKRDCPFFCVNDFNHVSKPNLSP